MELRPLLLSLAMLSGHALSDSAELANPTLGNSTATAKSACSNTYAEAVSAAGEPLFCYGGTWRPASLGGYERVQDYYLRKASDNYSTVVRIAYCPPGKQVIQALCNFNGGTNQNMIPLGHADGDRGAWCFYDLENAYEPSAPTGPANSLVTTAVCINKE